MKSLSGNFMHVRATTLLTYLTTTVVRFTRCLSCGRPSISSTFVVWLSMLCRTSMTRWSHNIRRKEGKYLHLHTDFNSSKQSINHNTIVHIKNVPFEIRRRRFGYRHLHHHRSYPSITSRGSIHLDQGRILPNIAPTSTSTSSSSRSPIHLQQLHLDIQPNHFLQ